ncbi:diacylglycerol kinase [Hathewaya histolytica]|uniref:Diacylglycerol kinase n=1 Tax=Hathewaya histolytica TaxID=1498 RepID=A0A4U9RHD7_HATHI|nr:diacylglycerol kinase [Hathewaya histolytica]VTQ90591.1 diacylglycerol kinase [Hathewaya histolytica]
MKNKNLVESFNCAIMGIIAAIKKERNMKIHIGIGILVLIFSLYSNITKTELFMVLFAITLVIVAEMINTSIEHGLDALMDSYHPLIKISKDVSAGAVLIAAINSIVVGYIVFWDKVKPITESIMDRVIESNPHTIFSILVIVSITTVLLKIRTGKGTPLKGGMPSGHSAIAFSIATIIGYHSKMALITLLGFVLAFIVAQSRVDSEVHSILEVILGCILGFLVTLLILILI